MKLIKRTYLSTLIWMIPAIVVGTVYCYFMIEYIEYEETDEFLQYEMERLVDFHEAHGELPEYHKVADILEDTRCETPVFKDTLLLESGDNEMVPYRELRFGIHHKGKDFTIVLNHLLLGHDDMFEGTLLIVAGLLLIFLLFVLLALRTITGKIWNPFYNTLGKLLKYDISSPAPHLQASHIDEFEQLNKVLTGLLEKVSQDFQINKEFNENISHELQSHLAIIRTNTEKLLNTVHEDSGQLKSLQSIYSSVNKLSHIQRALTLLHKIENGEFSVLSDVNLEDTVRQTLSTFEEVIDLQQIRLTTQLKTCQLNMDPGLAEILIGNLIKNAVVHNQAQGMIDLTLSQEMFRIRNSGNSYTDDPEVLFRRFIRGESGTTGIGLAMVDQICKIYGFQRSYTVSKDQIHTITVHFI